MNGQSIIFSIIVILMSINSAFAQFDFCSSNSANSNGSGRFQQEVPFRDTIKVGDIPNNVSDIKINLSSKVDIDIQLIDKQTGEKVIHWPDGLLAGSGFQQIEYKGNLIEWSGFNGDGSGLGNEYIHLSSAKNASDPINRPFTMLVYGYQNGNALVDYSWQNAVCEQSANGSGEFKQQIKDKEVVNVGTIPKGIENLSISLTSDKDVDIRLYDAKTGKALVAWPNGLLNGSSVATIDYKNMEIEWSGYSGDGKNKGHEYIKINGQVTTDLIMKAFGYSAGFATINYQWQASKDQPIEEETPPNLNAQEQQIKDEILGLINQARSKGRKCGNDFFPAVAPISWNSQLYQAALSHSKDMASKNFFSHTGSNGNNPGDRITNAGYKWSTYAENIAAGYPNANAVMQGWLDSPGHCKAIMNKSVSEVAVAIANGGTYGIYWTQVFAHPQ